MAAGSSQDNGQEMPVAAPGTCEAFNTYQVEASLSILLPLSTVTCVSGFKLRSVLHSMLCLTQRPTQYCQKSQGYFYPRSPGLGLWVLPSLRFPNGSEKTGARSRRTNRAEKVLGSLYSKRLSWAGMVLVQGREGTLRGEILLQLERHRVWEPWPGNWVHHEVHCFPDEIVILSATSQVTRQWMSHQMDQMDHWNIDDHHFQAEPTCREVCGQRSGFCCGCHEKPMEGLEAGKGGD